MSTDENATPRTKGRPLKDPADRKSSSVKFRTREDLRDLLEGAALASGRSVSEEAEIRMYNSFKLQPFHDLLFNIGGDGLRTINAILSAMRTIQDYENPPGKRLGSELWSESEGTRIAIQAAVGAILDSAAPLHPPADINLPPDQRSEETNEILHMREYGLLLGKFLTGQVQDIVDARVRQNDAKFISTSEH